MSLLNNEIQNQIREVLNLMKSEVTLVLFTKKDNCDTCNETSELLNEIATLSDKIKVLHKDFDLDLEEKALYNIQMAPSFVVLDSKGQDRGVKFNGIPAGHEINSFISALIEVGGNEPKYDEAIMEEIAKIDKPIDIKVFITLSCPHCPGAVQTAHRLAMLNPNVKAEMIEAQTFYDLSTKYQVSGVPKIVVNDKYELLGNQPVESFLELIKGI